MKVSDYIPQISPENIKTAIFMGGVMTVVIVAVVPAVQRLQSRKTAAKITSVPVQPAISPSLGI